MVCFVKAKHTPSPSQEGSWEYNILLYLFYYLVGLKIFIFVAILKKKRANARLAYCFIQKNP